MFKLFIQIQIHLFDSNFIYFMKLKKLYTYQAMPAHFAIPLMNNKGQKDGYSTIRYSFHWCLLINFRRSCRNGLLC